MFKNMLLCILFGFVLSACTTTSQITDTSTTVVFSAKRAQVKNALISTLADMNYSIKQETESQITFEKPTDNFAMKVFLGTGISPTPYIRISALFLNDAPTTVKFKGSIAINPNTGFERLDDYSDKEFKETIAKVVETMKPMLNKKK